MMRALGALALPFLQKLEPETAHRAAIAALRIAAAAAPRCDPNLSVAAFGLTFANPLGMAAGFDKNAEAPRGLLGAGFGFVEVGTLTPRPQPGNPRPRLFRLARDKALINRLGFNNAGYAAAHARLTRTALAGIVGVNIGPNKDSADRIADYVLGVATFADVASYFTISHFAGDYGWVHGFSVPAPAPSLAVVGIKSPPALTAPTRVGGLAHF